MALTEEEERAALWQRQQAARCEWRHQTLVGLQGDPEARLALERRWAPITCYLADLQAGPIPPELDGCCIPIEPLP